MPRRLRKRYGVTATGLKTFTLTAPQMTAGTYTETNGTIAVTISESWSSGRQSALSDIYNGRRRERVVHGRQL